MCGLVPYVEWGLLSFLFWEEFLTACKMQTYIFSNSISIIETLSGKLSFYVGFYIFPFFFPFSEYLIFSHFSVEFNS